MLFRPSPQHLSRPSTYVLCRVEVQAEVVIDADDVARDVGPCRRALVAEQRYAVALEYHGQVVLIPQEVKSAMRLPKSPTPSPCRSIASTYLLTGFELFVAVGPASMLSPEIVGCEKKLGAGFASRFHLLSSHETPRYMCQGSTRAGPAR